MKLSLSTKGICPLPSKMKAIQHMKPPSTPKQVRAFLGLVGFYQEFIKILPRLQNPSHFSLGNRSSLIGHQHTILPL